MSAENKTRFDGLTFVYRNWRGELSERTITSPSLWWGKTDYHPKHQWLLNGWDVHKAAYRDFAVAGILTPMRPEGGHG